MVFSSITFLFYFLPVFLFLYYLADRKYKNGLLLAFSVLFYSWGAPKFVFVLVASTIIDFYLVQWMHQCKQLQLKKWLLITSIALNVGLLAFFKYANFFVENLNEILTALDVTNLTWTAIALPIGISFYTFQTLTYSIDVYRGVHAPLQRVRDYVMYIMMFPQLIAGPIVRFNQIADQIENRKATTADRLLGFYRFCIGLAKKVLIANPLGAKAAEMLSMDLVQLDSTAAWVGILAFTMQIYFDFSGYSDMAIGLGRMIGFTFPENFRNPYTAQSITDFWRRWHITLSTWMRDYLYIPLGGNRVRKGRMYFNLWFVFLVSGLWHGAAWNFVLWGIYHGFFLVIERLFLQKILNRLPRFLRIGYAFFIVVLGWVIFWIEDINLASLYYQQLFSFDFSAPRIIPDPKPYIVFLVALFFAFFTLFPCGEKIQKRVFFGTYSKALNTLMFFSCLTLLIWSTAAILSEGFNPFIYFRF